MTPPRLAVAGVAAEFTEMHRGGVYWIMAAGSAPADLLGANTLAAAVGLHEALLITLGRTVEPVLALLEREQGPARLRLFQRSHPGMQQALRSLPRDLPRASTRLTELSLVQFPVAALDGWDDARLAHWCEQLRYWAQRARQVVVLLCYGEVATLAPRLLPLNRCCAGVVQLHPHRGALQLLLHYWTNSRGVIAQRAFALEQVGKQFQRVVQNDLNTEHVAVESGSDRDLFLAQTDVLEGAPPLSSAWTLYDGWTELMAAALYANEATVVVAIIKNTQVDTLARMLHRLRGERGNALKLVVRELQPCLRYADERLLLQCGGNLVVPAHTPFPRFLTLLDTVQRQRWQGKWGGDPEPLIRLHRPPSARGVVGIARFRQIALEYIDRDGSAVESALLALQPVAGLRAKQTLLQLNIRRQGDVACIYRGQLYLFLFGCRRDAFEQALVKLFHMPWHALFDGYQRLAEYDVLAMSVAGDDAEAEPLQSPARVPIARVPSSMASSFIAATPLRLGDDI